MFSKESYIIKAKKEAENYLKLTATMGIIRSKVCSELANEIATLEQGNYVDMMSLLKKYTAASITPTPLKGCHRHFQEKLKMLYKQVKYDHDLQNTINNIHAQSNESYLV